VCPIADALQLVGDKWALLALRELSFGVTKFNDICVNTGAPRASLTARLRGLEDSGLIERRRYSEHPPRYEYHLTQAGRELFPVMLALREWGDKWAVDSPSVEIRHECGHPLAVDRTCQHCGRPVTHDSTYPVTPAGSPADPD
jgi:DNA-binding HxlR family transcriptional regulator